MILYFATFIFLFCLLFLLNIKNKRKKYVIFNVDTGMYLHAYQEETTTQGFRYLIPRVSKTLWVKELSEALVLTSEKGFSLIDPLKKDNLHNPVLILSTK